MATCFSISSENSALAGWHTAVQAVRILFLAGVQLALNSKEIGSDKVDRFVVLTTAAFAVWNVGIAVLFGILVSHAAKRGWMKA